MVLGLEYRCGCVIAVLYPWYYYSTVLYNTMNCAMYYTSLSELWTLSDDHYYDVIKGRLFALHNNPIGPSGVERNHKATKPVHSRSRAWLGKHKIETGTAIMFNSKQLDRQIATTRDTKFCKWLQQLCPDSGYEAELEEDPVDEDEDGGGGSIDEFDHVDISEGVDGMHDEDIFEAEEVMDESNIYELGGLSVV